MVTTKDELLAANLRKQIAYLEGLVQELEATPVQDKPLVLKTREVETKLRELRTHL